MAITAQPAAVPARRRPILISAEYWHLLSLDAPCVAVLWAWNIGRSLRITLPVSPLLILFLGTWLLYVADRIFDGLHPGNSPRLRDRHLFYLRHRPRIIAAAIPIASLLTWLVLLHMRTRARRADAFLFLLAAVYFALIHLRGHAVERWFPKELLVGLIAAAAIAAPAWSRLPRRDSEAALIVAFLGAIFASVCWLNCIAIEKWEQPLEAPGRQLTNWTTQWGQKNLRLVSIAIAAAGVTSGAALFCLYLSAAAALCIAGTVSAILLALLDHAYPASRISAFHFRIAADAALLTPVLLIVFR